MPSNGLGAYSVKIHQVIFGGLFLMLAVLGIKSMAAGATTSIKMFAAISVLVGVVLALDKYYWILCPALMVIPVNIPGLPFDSGELARIAFIGIFFVRSALQKGATGTIRKEVLLAIPYFTWIAVIFCLNPPGMNIFGSETIGGRFYFQIALGFVTLLTFSRLSISEKDAKYWLYALVLGQSFLFLFSLFGGLQLEFQEQSSKYFLIPAAPLLLLLLCHYEIREIVSVIWRFWGALVLGITVAYSGKRTSMGQIFLAPMFLVFLRGREKALLGAFAIAASLFIGIVVMGQGNFYELPFSVQRSLSFLPGRWDQSLENYGLNDSFREELQRQAKVEIRASPFLGNKGYSINREQIVWMNASGSSMQGHEYVGNWHNKWYGMGADFGLPASFSWYFFSISAALYCIRNRKVIQHSKYRATCFLFYSLYMFYDLFFAFGHSAHTPYAQWTYFGFIVALVQSVDRERGDRVKSVDVIPV